MKAMAAVLFVVLCALATGSSACVQSSTPLAPASSDGTARFSGSINTMAGEKIAGAHLTVASGVNQGAQATTGADGRYEFGHLQTGEFNVLIEAPGFTSITPKIDLFGDIDANFALSSSF